MRGVPLIKLQSSEGEHGAYIHGCGSHAKRGGGFVQDMEDADDDEKELDVKAEAARVAAKRAQRAALQQAKGEVRE